RDGLFINTPVNWTGDGRADASEAKRKSITGGDFGQLDLSEPPAVAGGEQSADYADYADRQREAKRQRRSPLEDFYSSLLMFFLCNLRNLWMIKNKTAGTITRSHRRLFFSCFLPSAYCLLPTAVCLLPSAFCLLT